MTLSEEKKLEVSTKMKQRDNPVVFRERHRGKSYNANLHNKASYRTPRNETINQLRTVITRLDHHF